MIDSDASSNEEFANYKPEEMKSEPEKIQDQRSGEIIRKLTWIHTNKKANAKPGKVVAEVDDFLVMHITEAFKQHEGVADKIIGGGFGFTLSQCFIMNSYLHRMLEPMRGLRNLHQQMKQRSLLQIYVSYSVCQDIQSKMKAYRFLMGPSSSATYMPDKTT